MMPPPPLKKTPKNPTTYFVSHIRIDEMRGQYIIIFRAHNALLVELLVAESICIKFTSNIFNLFPLSKLLLN